MGLIYGWLLWVPEIAMGLVYGLFVRSWYLAGNKEALYFVPFGTWFCVTGFLVGTQIYPFEMVGFVGWLMAIFVYGVLYALTIGGVIFAIATATGAFTRHIFEGARDLFLALFVKS